MFVGLDVGYGQTKMSYASAVGIRKDLVWPSGAAPIERCDARAVASANGTRREIVSGVEVSVGGEKFGALMPPDAITGGMPYLHEDYPSTKEYMALAIGALSHVQSARIDVLVTGLPVAHHADPRKRESLRKCLCRKHEVNGRTINVARVEVVAQGLGAFIASNDVSDRETSNYDTVLVVDVGHYSVDWVLVSGGHWRQLGSGSSFNGAHTILRAASEIILARTRLQVSPDRVMRMVMDGANAVRVGDHTLDMDGVIAEAAEHIVPRVTSEIRSALANDAEVTALVVTGGGAAYYRDSLFGAFPHANHLVHPNPAMANAIGFQSLAESYGAAELRA